MSRTTSQEITNRLCFNRESLTHQELQSVRGRMILWAHWLYKSTISPLLGQRCRFEPPCSDYAALAVVRFGFVRGVLLGLGRLIRCHPWCKGGVDPVPSSK